MGLLSRANTLDELKSNPGLSFSDFIIKHQLKICALLEKKAADYIVTNSIGFDASSILSATSTADYWDGICKTPGQIYNFSGSEKTQFLQLFSFGLKDCIEEISVYKNKAFQILIYSGKLTDSIVKDFEAINSKPHQNNINKLNPLIKKNSVLLLLKLDFSEAIKSFYEKVKPSNYDLSAFQKTLMNEFYNRFTCRYNICDTSLLLNNECLKTVFITNKEYSVELISHHIKLNLKEVFDEAELIQICFAGTADSCDKVQKFLQME